MFGRQVAHLRTLIFVVANRSLEATYRTGFLESANALAANITQEESNVIIQRLEGPTSRRLSSTA
jgi:hypothetical protein